MIFQNQQGRRGTASGAEWELKSDESDTSPREEFVRVAATLMWDQTKSGGLEDASAELQRTNGVGKIFQNSDVVRKCRKT